MNPDSPHTRRTLPRAAGAVGLGAFARPAAADPDQSVAATDADHVGSCGGADATSPPPGPSYLYGENPTPPQLENGPGWDADPLLVSGTEAYVEGEYLYQDYLGDDHGANTAKGAPSPSPEPEDDAVTFARPTGDVVYPTDDARFRDNAADLLEFRARPSGAGVAYRTTLNTMVVPDAAAVAIGIVEGTGSDGDGRTDWGYGLGDLGAPVDHVLVVWGTGGESDAEAHAELDGERLADERVSVNVERNQLEVEAPLDPDGATWRHYAVVGLFDPQTERFRQIREQPSEDQPGGAHGENPPPVFNVAFRFEEPFGAFNLEPGTTKKQLGEVSGDSRGPGIGNWREHAQALALAKRDISEFGADIDFETLRARETDRRVPESGLLSLLYPSRLDGDTLNGDEGIDAENNIYVGRIQPYTAYVPESYADGDGPPTPTPLLLLMHSLSSCFTQYSVFSPNILRQLGEQNDTIVFTPEARGPSGWYQREAEVAVFEAWRDLETRFEIDRDRVSLSGYSMGGYGTFKLGSQYPDLFARGFAIVGPPDEDIFGGPTGGRVDAESNYSKDPENTLRVTDNLRHVPLLMWNGANDELVPLPGPVIYGRQLREHGYRHELDIFPGYDHFLFAIRDQWGPGKEFLSGATVTDRPPRVTYRRVPDFDHPDFDLVHDGAYWLSSIGVPDDPSVPESETSGLVDAISLADGYGEPVTVDYDRLGTEPAPHEKRGTEWKEPIAERPPENALEVTLENVSDVTLWVEEAGLDPRRELTLRVESDRSATLTLAGSFGIHDVTVSTGETETTVRLCGGS